MADLADQMRKIRQQVATKHRMPVEVIELMELGVSCLRTLGPYKRPGWLAAVQRDHTGGVVLWIAPDARMTPEQAAAMFDMARSAALRDGRLPPFDEWDRGFTALSWVYGVTPERAAAWRDH